MDQKAFTLVELLIVMAISLIIIVVALPIYGNLQVSSQLNENSLQIIQTLRTARTMSIAGYNNEPHGVKFESSSYTLYQGASYDTRISTFDRVMQIGDALIITSDLAGDEVNFSKGLGVPSNTGTITLTHDVSGDREIVVNSLGVVEEE